MLPELRFFNSLQKISKHRLIAKPLMSDTSVSNTGTLEPRDCDVIELDPLEEGELPRITPNYLHLPNVVDYVVPSIYLFICILAGELVHHASQRCKMKLCQCHFVRWNNVETTLKQRCQNYVGPTFVQCRNATLFQHWHNYYLSPQKV